MKIRNLLTLFVVGSALIGSSVCLAGFGSHGGDGVVVRGKLYLFDLFEQGVHESPSMGEGTAVADEWVRQVSKKLSVVPVNVRLVAQKLQSIHEKKPLLANAFLKAMGLINWRVVNERLIDVNDLDGSDIDCSKYKLVQIAARSLRSITIDLKFFNLLDPSNQVALIFHELVYAIQDSDGAQKSSRVAREINGYFFSPRFDLDTAGDVFGMLGRDRLPWSWDDWQPVATTPGNVCFTKKLVSRNVYKSCLVVGWGYSDHGISWEFDSERVYEAP